MLQADQYMTLLKFYFENLLEIKRGSIRILFHLDISHFDKTPTTIFMEQKY